LAATNFVSNFVVSPPRMQLAVLLWTLLASSSALSPGARPRICRREALCGGAAAAALLVATPPPAFADYGQAAGQKLPAFVPSPIRPTGEMAKTCEIVALGREVATARSKRSPEATRRAASHGPDAACQVAPA
jgi:hypothetical protein